MDFPHAFGLVGAGSLLIRDFLRFEKSLSADSSVSIDWPTGHVFERAGRRPFLPNFFVENGKIFVGKKWGKLEKIFAVRKFLTGEFLVKTKKRAMP